MASKRVEFTTDDLLDNLTTVKDQVFEDRTLAIDRYKRVDETLTSDEQFVLVIKGMTDLLKIACDRSNALFALAKLQAQIIFKDQQIGSSGNGLSDEDIKNLVQKEIEDSEKNGMPDFNDNKK